MRLLAVLGWRGALALALGVALTIQTLRIEGFLFVPGLKADLAAALDVAAKEAAAHQQSKRNYQAAQAAAARAEAARLARVLAQQKGITDDVRHDYAKQLAAARARYDALARSGGMRGPEGRTGVGGQADRFAVSELPSASGGADGAAGAGGLSLAERWTATKQALQLNALIDWVERQLSAPVNDPAPASTGAP